MKKLSLIVFLFFSCFCFASGLLEKETPTSECLALFDFFELPHEETLENLALVSRLHWMQAGKERWQFEEKYPGKELKALELLKNIGCIDAVTAPLQRYDYALILGALTKRMEKRLKFLIQEWERGVRFDTLVLLTGQRDLDPSQEKIFSHVKTETESFLFLYHHIPMPQELKNIPLVVIDTPKRWNLRPNTADTVKEWLKSSPKPGTCLVISDQPFIGYQDAVLRRLLPSTFIIRTVGERATQKTPLSVYLDTIARWLEQELLISHSHH